MCMCRCNVCSGLPSSATTQCSVSPQVDRQCDFHIDNPIGDSIKDDQKSSLYEGTSVSFISLIPPFDRFEFPTFDDQRVFGLFTSV